MAGDAGASPDGEKSAGAVVGLGLAFAASDRDVEVAVFCCWVSAKAADAATASDAGPSCLAGNPLRAWGARDRQGVCCCVACWRYLFVWAVFYKLATARLLGVGFWLDLMWCGKLEN